MVWLVAWPLVSLWFLTAHTGFLVPSSLVPLVVSRVTSYLDPVSVANTLVGKETETSFMPGCVNLSRWQAQAELVSGGYERPLRIISSSACQPLGLYIPHLPVSVPPATSQAVWSPGKPVCCSVVLHLRSSKGFQVHIFDGRSFRSRIRTGAQEILLSPSDSPVPL